jgi:5-methylcytosine-specific restriction endonuclease McrA
MIKIIGYSADVVTGKKRRYIPKRSELNHCQKQYCCYCKKHLDETNYTIEHLLAIDRGGKNGKYNLRPCCSICNKEKSNLLLEEWLAILQDRRFALTEDEYKINRRKIARVTKYINHADYKLALLRSKKL